MYTAKTVVFTATFKRILATNINVAVPLFDIRQNFTSALSFKVSYSVASVDIVVRFILRIVYR